MTRSGRVCALSLILLAACGSSAPPAAAPAPTAEPVPVAQVQQPAPAAEPPAESEGSYIYGEAPLATPPPATAPAAKRPPPTPVYDRLQDIDGPIAGLPGFSIKRTPSTSHCGGMKITTKRGKKIAAADKHLATVFALEFPTGLDFDPDPKHKATREKSMQTFNDFVSTMMKLGGEATTFYADQAKTATDAAAKASALARVVQIQFRLASVLARGEIPKDVRSGEFKDEKVAAFCDKMSEVSEPLLAQAESALELCAATAKQSSTTGWWNDVCGPAK